LGRYCRCRRDRNDGNIFAGEGDSDLIDEY
jgi:hypothetical protein